MIPQEISGELVRSGVKGLIYVPIYAPWRVDTQSEAILPELLEETAHKFAASGKMGNVKIAWKTREHDGAVPAKAQIVETFVAGKGDPRFPVPGTWAAAIKLEDPRLIEAVEEGKINAVSLESEYPPTRTPLPTLVSNPIAAQGETEPTFSSSVEPHTHGVTLQFNEKAEIIPTQTDHALGHRHWIYKPTATESAEGLGREGAGGHGHPLDLQKLATDYKDVLEVVTWLSDLTVGAITLVEHAASWMPVVSMKGDEMAGGIVQAIIIPEGANLELLKELLGEDFEKIRTDNPVAEGGSTVYVQAQKSDFEELTPPRNVAGTPIQVITGRPKKVDKNEAEISVDEFRSVVGGSAKADVPVYGLSDLASRLLGELKRFEKTITSEVREIRQIAEKAEKENDYKAEDEDKHIGFDGLVQKLMDKGYSKESATKIAGKVYWEQQGKSDDGDNKKEEEDMSDYVTKKDLAEALDAFAEKCNFGKPEEAKKADSGEELAGAMKPVLDGITSLQGLMEKDLPELKEKMATIEAELTAVKADIDKTKAVTEAIQRVTRTPHAEVDPLALKNDSAKPEQTQWQQHFETRRIGGMFRVS